MANPRQNHANRANARLSTGPRTEVGKAVSSKNALRHGLLSKNVLLPSEDSMAFHRFHEDIYSDLRPLGQIEAMLTDIVVASAWRLRRLYVLEASVLSRRVPNQDVHSMLVALILDGRDARAFRLVPRYVVTIERGLYRAMYELRKIQAQRRSADASSGRPGQQP